MVYVECLPGCWEAAGSCPPHDAFPPLLTPPPSAPPQPRLPQPRLDDVIADLLGPVRWSPEAAGSCGWVPDVLGLPKRRLLRDVVNTLKRSREPSLARYIKQVRYMHEGLWYGRGMYSMVRYGMAAGRRG